ncbi:DUF4129 domain-containing protein [Mucilaginibacter sp. FT3.2]|uniref:DUF4129 domain-containing protein n=1 Tax=Mucilaginibacter sp. FT3.2 TaxID=2723090 RepID=UPI00161529EA|nr:DUF4129 domain-containing protein [Mucilaginibacter sp. FT3.2]MBB6234473.1 hypothetical protein [Mucilaginibacter sp. FT3.2]
MFKPLVVLFALKAAERIKTTPVPKAAFVKTKAIPAILKSDTTKINLRHFDAPSLKAYKNDKDFNYHTEKAAITWWDKFWNWVWHLWDSFWQWVGELLRKLFGGSSMGHNTAVVFKYAIIGMFAFAVIYIILKLLGINAWHLFKKDSKQVPIPYNESIENIHEISFDEAIENALAIKNYRLAVRLLYLRSLKQLSDNNLINWRIEKTNLTYINELADAAQRRQFIIVTKQFEYVWYGDFPVDGESYQKINAIFHEFKQQLS